ncbi:hypothetical protein [Rhodopila sp.]|uniref:hypothetical protein n=1 Tax=Rhodopila sp. TaxID=2480087 RepID=UPI002C9EC7D6|nr:hypothetical protein [Rhodopila sp.]HVZ06472.1 hypothetical protein [Rhodopila sp.]
MRRLINQLAHRTAEEFNVTSLKDGGYRRNHLRLLAQRVEVEDKEVRIMGSKNGLLRTLTASAGVRSAAGGVRSFV